MIVNHDWSKVLGVVASNAKADSYQKTIDSAVSHHFKLIMTTRKLSNPSWINAGIKRRVRQRKDIFKREGRAAAWKCLKKVMVNMIKKRRQKYMDSQQDVLLKEDSERNLFKNIKSLSLIHI